MISNNLTSLFPNKSKIYFQYEFDCFNLLEHNKVYIPMLIEEPLHDMLPIKGFNSPYVPWDTFHHPKQKKINIPWQL